MLGDVHPQGRSLRVLFAAETEVAGKSLFSEEVVQTAREGRGDNRQGDHDEGVVGNGTELAALAGHRTTIEACEQVINKRVIAFLVLLPAPPCLTLPLPLTILGRHLGYQLDLACLSMSVLHRRVYDICILIRYRYQCEVFLALIIFQDLIQHLRGGPLASSLFDLWQALDLKSSSSLVIRLSIRFTAVLLRILGDQGQLSFGKLGGRSGMA